MAFGEQGLVRKGMRKAFQGVLPSERQVYLQKRAENRFDRFRKIAKVYEQIEGMYNQIKGRLDGFYNTIADDKLFSPNSQVVGTGRNRKSMVWRLRQNKDITPKVVEMERQLTFVLEQLNWIDRVDIIIENAEQRLIEQREAERKIKEKKEIRVTANSLIKILEKFERIWKRIKELERRKEIVNDIKIEYREFFSKIKNDFGLVYLERNLKKIRSIRDKLFKRLTRINEELLQYITQEYELEAEEKPLAIKLEQDEGEAIKILARGLMIDRAMWIDAVRRYPGLVIPPELKGYSAPFLHNLSEREHEIIIGKVTPLILRLIQLTGMLIKLIKSENEMIIKLQEAITTLGVAKRKKSTEERQQAAKEFLQIIDKLYDIINRNEVPLINHIEAVEKDLMVAIKSIKQIQDVEESIGKKIKGWEEQLRELKTEREKQ